MLAKRIRPIARFLLHWTCRLSLGGVVLFVIAWFACPFPEEAYRHYNASSCITDRHGEILRTTLSPTGQRCLPIVLEDAGEWFPNAIIATEDKRFYNHQGVDFLALGRAIGQMIWHRKVVSGASTISTQVIRLVKPRPRNLFSKNIEAFRALQMETVFTKEEILEQYLNRTPFGGNLVGIRAASLHYFSKEPANLSLEEASLLAGLPQSPNHLRPDRHPAMAKKRRDHVLERMAECKFLKEEQQLAATGSPIILEPWKPPFHAPHFVDAVLQGSLQTSPKTTLDLHLQQLVEDLLARHPSGKAKGAAIVLLDAPTGQILSMVGSPDYLDQRNAGQVNAALARRSPGSTLKSFAYALAFDRGQLSPEEVLKDTPLGLPGYHPDNFDETFRENVSARQALVESLNLPAIEVVRRTGQKPFLELLQALGLSTLSETSNHYGLNLILGGGEVRLLDLARAYARIDDALSPEAAYLVTEILSGNERDFAVFGHGQTDRRPKVAWKTGTSARSRDAWTVAWNKQYVVGVWRGNPDGSPCPGLTGIEDAAPLALEIFMELPQLRDSQPVLSPMGLNLAQRTVCAVSGLPLSPDCANGIEDWHLPGISKNTPCRGRCRNQSKSTQQVVANPKILRPINGQTFALLPGRKNPILSLEAKCANNLYWFVNGTYFAKSSTEEILQLPLQPGTFEITCTTDTGHADMAKIVVE